MTESKPPTRKEVQIALGLTAVLFFFFFILYAAFSHKYSSDFNAFYAGGRIIREGEASRLYDLGEQARIEKQTLRAEDLIVNAHPPFEALWFACLARLSLVQAYVLWGAINVLLWFLSQRLLWLNTRIPQHFYGYLLITTLFLPFWGALMLGQTSLLALLVFSLTIVCLQRGQDFRAGIYLGLGLFKFPVVLPFAMICLLRSRWKVLAGFASAALPLATLSVIAVGSEGVLSYGNLLAGILRNPGNPIYRSMRFEERMPTVTGLLTTLLSGRLPPHLITMLVVAISGSLVLFIGWRWRQEDAVRGGDSLALMFAAALAVSLAAAPHLYVYDLTLMWLAMFLVVNSPQWSQRAGQRTFPLGMMIVLCTPVTYLLLSWWKLTYLLAPVLVVFALASLRLATRAEYPAERCLALTDQSAGGAYVPTF
jgi:hypothetical protein